jgi:hypothetical protein
VREAARAAAAAALPLAVPATRAGSAQASPPGPRFERGAHGVASLAATDMARGRKLIGTLWNLEVPKSQVFRYYDGPLYMMSLMHASGRFQVIEPASVGEPGRVS